MKNSNSRVLINSPLQQRRWQNLVEEASVWTAFPSAGELSRPPLSGEGRGLKEPSQTRCLCAMNRCVASKWISKVVGCSWPWAGGSMRRGKLGLLRRIDREFQLEGHLFGLAFVIERPVHSFAINKVRSWKNCGFLCCQLSV